MIDTDPTPIVEVGKTYFEQYEVKENDLMTLSRDIETVVDSDLVDASIFDDLRFVTYDSQYLYVFTRGEHASSGRFTVEELPTNNNAGMRLFKIIHSGFIGRDRESYKGARAWLLCDELEQTAVNAKKYPNENVLYQKDLAQPEDILRVVSMAPAEPYNKIQKGRFNLLTDVVFHEAAHKEHEMLDHWQKGEDLVPAFPSKEAETRFLDEIKQCGLFPQPIMQLIFESITRRAVCEMFAMLIDNEAAKRYDQVRFSSASTNFEVLKNQLWQDPVEPQVFGRFTQELKWEHCVGRLLVRMLEARFPDFVERKEFVRSILDRHPRA